MLMFICRTSNPRKRQNSYVIDNFAASRCSVPETRNDCVTSTVDFAYENNRAAGDANFAAHRTGVIANVAHRRDVAYHRNVITNVARHRDGDFVVSPVRNAHMTDDKKQCAIGVVVDRRQLHQLKLQKGLTENLLVDLLLEP